MLTLKRGIPASDANKEPGRHKSRAFKRAAAVLSAAAASIALASGCGGPLANVSSEYPVYAPPRPRVRLLDWLRIPEPSAETLEALALNLDGENPQLRGEAVHGLAFLYASGNADTRRQIFEMLIQTAKTDPDPNIAAQALSSAGRIGLLNRDFSYAQREQLRGLVISALSSEDVLIRRIAQGAIPPLNHDVAASLTRKEVDSFIDMLRIIQSYDPAIWLLVADRLGSISGNPRLSGRQIDCIIEMLEGQLVYRAVPALLFRVFDAFNTLAANPSTTPLQAGRMMERLEALSDDSSPIYRRRARFHLAFLALCDKSASESDVAQSIGFLLKDGVHGFSETPYGFSVPIRLLTMAEIRSNPAHVRRNAYLAVRICVESGNIPPDITLARLLERVRADLNLERDHSVRAEAKALLSIIPQP